MIDAAVDAMLRRRPPPPKRFATRVREYYRLADLSRVYRLITQKDYYTTLPAVARTTASWKTLLDAVSHLCTEELFKKRVLSRDMLRVSDDIADLFHSLCTKLRR